MDNIKASHSSTDSTTITSSTTTTSAATSTTAAANSNNNRDQFLRHLNKLSHKISKPTNPNPNLPPSNVAGSSTFRKPPPIEPPLQPPVHPPQQQQPPVYNINKSDFRDVVQKLTGSPAHAATPAAPAPPPPIHAPKPASSRLQRIRPPPLAQLSTRPPSLLNSAVNPLSPLPPLPTCHAAAESPISAYMRFLHNSVSAVDSSLNRTIQMLPPSSPPSMNPQADTSAAFPSFGCLPSPKSPCPMIPPNLMFSPTGSGPLGFSQLPMSPTVPGVPSPKWRDL